MLGKLKEIFSDAGCFGIDISIQQDYPFLEKNKKTILRLNPGSSFSIENPVIIDADPFLFVYNDILYLFYEDLTFFNRGGNINMTSTTDLTHWTKPITILNEKDVHFSFPYVFEDNGNVYMVPETGQQGEIRLYCAKNRELTEFEHVCNLLERSCPVDCTIDLADNVIYKDKENDIYYLFTSRQDKNGYMLELYTSNTLRGPYTIHPSSPIVHSNKYGRNGGSLLQKEQMLFRVAQDCSATYGGDIHLMQIDNITPTSYREHPYKENLIPKELDFYKEGGHQLNFTNYKGKIIVATDAKQDKVFYFVRIVNKILTKLHFRKPYV